MQSDVIDSVTKKHGATLVGWKIGAYSQLPPRHLMLLVSSTPCDLIVIKSYRWVTAPLI